MFLFVFSLILAPYKIEARVLVISAHEAGGGDEASGEEEGSYVLQHRHLLQCLQKVTVSGKHGNDGSGREVEWRGGAG